MPPHAVWQLRDLIVCGPDPFGLEGIANAEAVGASTLALRPGAVPRAPARAEDCACASGYGYVIRPVRSDDPAENVVLRPVLVAGAPRAVATSAPLRPGQPYRIVAIEADGAKLQASGLSVCFAAGTLIATRRGPRPVETLRPGDRLQTSDNGYRAVDWVGRWRVNGQGASAPVRIAAGVLGNDRPLFVSGHHRVLLRPTTGPLAGEEVLVAAKTLVGLPGIARTPCARIEWVHVLLPAHEVIFAENARAESLLGGHRTRALLEPEQARLLGRALHADPLRALPVRPIVPPGKVARLILQHRAGRNPAQSAGLMLG